MEYGGQWNGSAMWGMLILNEISVWSLLEEQVVVTEGWGGDVPLQEQHVEVNRLNRYQ